VYLLLLSHCVLSIPLSAIASTPPELTPWQKPTGTPQMMLLSQGEKISWLLEDSPSILGAGAELALPLGVPLCFLPFIQ